MGIPKGTESKTNGESSTLGLVAVGAEGAAENPGTRGNGGNRDEIQDMKPTHKNEDKSLVLLQVNCRSIYNKSLEFWNLVDMYNPDIIIGTESWLREDIGNAELFWADYTTFRRDRQARGGGVFICVKNNIACSELWVDDDFEILAIEVKGSDPSYMWEIIRTYRAPNEDLRIIESLAARTGFLGNSIKQSIIGGDLNLPQVNWKGIADSSSAAQTFIKRLVWDSRYTQVVVKPTRGDSLLDVYLLRPNTTLISCDTLKGSVTTVGYY